MPDWYTASGWPGQGSAGESAPGRAEFVAIAANFLKMPTLTGRANRPVFVNASGTGLNSPTAESARELLGLEIGVNVQAFSTVLQNTTASFQTTDETKLDLISVSQAINLDTVASQSGGAQFFSTDHYTDSGRHKQVTLEALGSAPAVSGQQGTLYAKMVSGMFCWFLKNAVDGVEVQITNGPGLNVALPEDDVEVATLTTTFVAALPVELTIEHDGATSYVELDWSLGTSFSLVLDEDVDEFRFIGMDAAQARSICVEVQNTGSFVIASFIPNGTWVVMKPRGSSLAVVADEVTNYGCTLFPAERMSVFPVEMEEHAP